MGEKRDDRLLIVLFETRKKFNSKISPFIEEIFAERKL